MEKLRPLFFVVALVLVACVVLAEVGALGILRGAAASAAAIGGVVPDDGDVRDAFDEQRDEVERVAGQDKPPGMAIPYMALLDGTLLFSAGLMGMALLVRERIQARVQGVLSLIFSLLALGSGIGMLLLGVASILLMIALFLSVPFGTLAYLAVFGFFNRSGAAAALGLLMALKVGFAVCLVLAHPRFLQNRGLVLTILTSLVGNVIIGFLHGIVPRFLVSITDALGAIVVVILGLVWAIVLLVGSILSIVRALRMDRV